MRLDVETQNKLAELRESIKQAWYQDLEDFDFIMHAMMDLIDIIKEGN